MAIYPIHARITNGVQLQQAYKELGRGYDLPLGYYEALYELFEQQEDTEADLLAWDYSLVCTSLGDENAVPGTYAANPQQPTINELVNYLTDRTLVIWCDGETVYHHEF